MKTVTVLAAFLGFCSAFPAQDPVIQKYDPQRFHHIPGPDDRLHLVDLWLKASDLQEAARYTPDTQNVYHLFTRANPTVSQPLLLNDERLLGSSNFDPQKRTVMLVHGWLGSVIVDFNTVLVPAILETEDVNVIVADWNAGAGHDSYLVAVLNTVTSGEGIGRFINWLNRVTGATASQYHIIGHSLGGHQSGIIGRNVEGDVSYITSVDPPSIGWITNDHKFRYDDGSYTEVFHTSLLGYFAPLDHVDFYPNGGIDMPGCGDRDCDHDRWLTSTAVISVASNHQVSVYSGNVPVFLRIFPFPVTAVDPASPAWNTNSNRFRADDGAYTEVIHTNVGLLGFLGPLGQVDFYPNGGINMPGCGNSDCDHDRGFYYLAESIRTGGFTGRQCLSFLTALTGNCQLWGRLQMGGLTPKTGSTGVYYVETNAAPPFSMD